MSTTELRSMAQRIMQCYEAHKNGESAEETAKRHGWDADVDKFSEQLADSFIEICGAYLATTADDDDEPVTVERLLAAGGEQIDDEIVRFTVEPFELFVWTDEGTFNLGDAEQRAPVKNMRDVRALLAALGVGR